MITFRYDKRQMQGLWNIIQPKYLDAQVIDLKNGRTDMATLKDRLDRMLMQWEYEITDDLGYAKSRLKQGYVCAAYKCCVTTPDEDGISIAYRNQDYARIMVIPGIGQKLG